MAGTETLKQIRVGLGIVISQGQILICRRKKNDSFGGYWEFPGGKCEAGETIQQCVQREMLEELAIHVTPVRALAPIEHRYPSAAVTLYPFICRHDSGEPVALCASEFRWVATGSLREFQFPPANVSLIATLEGIDLAAGEA
jgi:mutator protein MutT